MTKTRQPEPETATVVITVRVPRDLADAVRAIAAERDEPLSAPLRRSLDNYRRNYGRLLRDREGGRRAAS